MVDLAGLNKAFFCGWHVRPGHGSHCTHGMPLQVSMSIVWVTAGVPRPTVMMYSKVCREEPSLVGTVTSPPPCFAASVTLMSFWMLTARSRSL